MYFLVLDHLRGCVFFFSSRRRHTRLQGDWSSDVCSSDLEWANFRSTHSSSGWSARGGQTLNPHALNRTPSGSSSGSAVAVAGGLWDRERGGEGKRGDLGGRRII